jgi:hypothetical protein
MAPAQGSPDRSISRMRAYTESVALSETPEEDTKNFHSVFESVKRQKQRFGAFCASKRRLLKLVQACQLGDSPRALETTRNLLGEAVKDTLWNAPSRSPEEPNKRESVVFLGTTRTQASENLTIPRHAGQSWRSGIAPTRLLDRRTVQDGEIKEMLLIACRYNMPEVVQFLLANGADINESCSDAFTPIHVACLFGSNEVITEIIKHQKPEVCLIDDEGTSPLHLIVLSGTESALEVLLELGADLLAEDHEHRLPLYYAFLRRDRAI